MSRSTGPGDPDAGDPGTDESPDAGDPDVAGNVAVAPAAGGPPAGEGAATVARDGRLQVAGLLAGFAALAVLMTFPHPGRLGTHVLGDNGDAMLNLWTVDWVWHSWRDGWSALWSGQMFQPHERTLAYSESLLPAAAAYGLLRLVVRSDVAAFNLVVLASWTASQWWAYRLFRRFTPVRAVAALGAVAFTFSAARVGLLVHFQLSAGCFVPLVVLCTLRHLEAPSVRRGLQLGGSLAVTTLSASYYGLMMVVATALVSVSVLAVRRTWPSRDLVLRLVPGVLLAGVLVGPVALQYVLLQRDPHFRRGPEAQFSAGLRDFLAVAHGNRWIADLPPFDRYPAQNIELSLYPGVVTTVFAVVGVGVLVARRRPGAAARSRVAREVVALGVAGACLIVLAAGDEVELAGHTVTMPYRLLRAAVPVFDGVRATVRFGIVFQLALDAFAVVGLGAVVGAVHRRWVAPTARFVVGGVAATLVAIVLVESAVSAPTVRVPDADRWTAVNRELADRPTGLVVELPVRQESDLALWPFVEAPRLVLARIDDDPRVNGYSGFEPPGFGEVANALNSFPGPDALAVIDDLGIRYVVIRTETVGWHDAELAARLDAEAIGAWDDALAAERLAAIPSGRAVSVEQVGEAWLVEMTERPG